MSVITTGVVETPISTAALEPDVLTDTSQWSTGFLLSPIRNLFPCELMIRMPAEPFQPQRAVGKQVQDGIAAVLPATAFYHGLEHAVVNSVNLPVVVGVAVPLENGDYFS